MYSKQGVVNQEEDPRYEKLMTSFDRFKKIFTLQHEAITDIDNDLATLLQRRNDREARGKEYLQQLRLYR